VLSLHAGRIEAHGHRFGRDRAILLGSLGAVVAAGWAAIAIWGASPWSRYLGHEGLAQGADAADTLLFVGGWLLMTVAMMVPTTWPLLATFQALVRRRRRPGLLVVLLAAGYVVTWSIVGVLLHSGDRLVHAGVEAIPWLGERAGLIAAGTVLVAGVYQFAPLKYRCLDECRSPLGFVMNHWRGENERREAFALGVRHGLFCVGCCWSLMLLMFAVGMGSLAWMFALGAVMAIEKNATWGRQLSKPLGIVLIAAGSALSLAVVLPGTS
jgi:predicted metal-binding membrane protein